MERHYIGFEEARKILSESIFELEKIEIEVKDSCGYVLAENIRSPIPLPPYTSSAMDGYAISGNEMKFKLVGEIKAGDTKEYKLGKGEAMKVFTGSKIPKMTYAVVPKEQAEEKEDGTVYIKKEVKKFQNIRFKGEEVKKGETVLKKGLVITPPVVGFLSIMGIKKVKVIRKPRVSCIITGNEIVEPGRKLKDGQIYDANSFSLYSALKAAGIEKITMKRVKDNPKLITKTFRALLENSDIIIFSGGISVGEYDFVRDVFQKEKIKPLFYKVRQKPGKPIFVGTKGEKFIFALPGNPAATLVCFYEYILPVIRGMMGYKKIFPDEVEMILGEDINKKEDRLYFIRAKRDGEMIYPLPNQESHMLSSFALADSIIILPENIKEVKKGEKVKVHILPF